MNLTKDINSRATSTAFEAGKSVNINGLYELTKPRLSLLSVFTASLGFLVHDPLIPDLGLFIALTLGTTLAAGGAATLNQWIERKEDALMARTASRPACKACNPRTSPWIWHRVECSWITYFMDLDESLGHPSHIRHAFYIFSDLYPPEEKITYCN